MRGLPRRRAFGGERGRFYRVTPGALFASMLIGTVGFGFFIYGKKQRRAPHLAAGVLLMVYPYFVPGVTLMVVIAGAIVGSLYLASYLGL
jgi:hypothetical protein